LAWNVSKQIFFEKFGGVGHNRFFWKTDFGIQKRWGFCWKGITRGEIQRGENFGGNTRGGFKERFPQQLTL